MARRSIVGSAKLIAVCTLGSRITGLVRDILLAQAFGLAWVQDAWVYAFQFPNLFRRLFGEGALAAAFVPTFTQTLERDGEDSAWGLLARTLALVTVTLSALIGLIALIILGIWLATSGPTEVVQTRGLLLSLTALMLPFMLTVCVLALFSSILNCVGSFVPAALTPVLLNVCMIIGIGWLAPALYPDSDRSQVYVVALTVLAAGVLQILVILPVVRAHGVRLGWKWDLRDAGVRRMLKLVTPVLLGQGVLTLGVFLDAQICVLLTHKAGTPASATWLGWTFAYPLEEGALSAVTYAQRLYQFPLGVLVISLATAALPTFSRLAAREDWGTWLGEVRQALRLAVFEGLLAGVMMIVLAEPIVRLLFEYRDFSADDTQRAARILTIYGFGMWAFCAQHIVTRAFYSVGDVRTPLKISLVLLPVNLALNLVLIWFEAIREAAFAISTSLTYSLAVVVGLLLLRKRSATKLLDMGSGTALVRMVIAAGAAAVVLVLVQPAWAHFAAGIPGKLATRAVETFGLLGIGACVFLLAAWLLRLREVRLLVVQRPRRGNGGEPTSP